MLDLSLPGAYQSFSVIMSPDFFLVAFLLAAGHAVSALQNSPAGVPPSSDIIAHAHKHPADGFCVCQMVDQMFLVL